MNPSRARAFANLALLGMALWSAGPAQAQCPPFTLSGALTSSDPTFLGRLNRFFGGSTCAAPLPCPGLFSTVGDHHYDTYVLVNQGALPQCVSVTATTPCANNNYIHVSAYLGAFDPTDLCANYLADVGGSPDPIGFMSFIVPAGATFIVVVNEAFPGFGCPGYELLVDGGGAVCAPVPQDRVSATEKGSALIFSKVELRYTAAGVLIQDTFIDIANDFPGDVNVKMYFVNGDPRVVVGGVLIEPGWNWVNNQIELTANEPTYWSAATGLPKGVSPFGVLDPGALPGRPDPEVPGERMLRGFIVAFAVNEFGCEIRWNHLKGDACIVNYAESSAWEYNAWAFQAGGGNGEPLPNCGTLLFNGVEYAAAFDQLLLDFYAVGSAALSTDAGILVTVNTDLTLHPLSADLRQETTGPVRTKASFDIWNMNEVKFSGTDRCVTCWDQALLSSYGLPNHFFLVNLQTDKGRARINDIASAVVCPGVENSLVNPLPSIDPLLGVAAKHLTFDGVAFERAGGNLHGLGTQTDGVIRFDPVSGGPPGESTGGMGWLNAITGEINNASRPRR